MHWWQTGIIYQIYPRSFQDTNADGVGDLNGIRRRLDYLEALNVDAIWISPIFPSPMHDFGYDVADYCDIHPLFGTLDDFDRLLAEAHGRGLRVILDLVPNHTSEEHAWFVESRSSRDNPKRDTYIWADPAPGDGPPETRLPNNWQTHFGGDAWTYDAPTGQFYMHQFHRSQPELNYRHPDVLPAMLDNMRFWLDRGVDGFRVDVIWLMLKDAELRDEPLNPHAGPDARPFDRIQHIYTADVDGIHDIVRQMRAVLDAYDERIMAGEIYLPLDRLMSYYGDEIGMEDVPIPFDECMDPAALQQPELFEVWGRDPERTPMQWDDSPNAGFAPDGARPWLPLAADYATRNVAAQENDRASMLTLFRALTALRQAEPALNRGGIELINTGIEDVLAYRRTVEGGDSFLIILNFGKEMQELDLHAAFGVTKAEVVLSTEAPRSRLMNRVSTSIGGNEGLILRLPELTA